MKKLSVNIIRIICKYSDIKHLHCHLSLYEKHLDKVNWFYLLYNSIPLSFLEKHFTSKDGTCFSGLDKIDWITLSQNTNIPFTFFEKHLDKVNWNYLSRNTNIPFTFFEKHLDKVNWNNLSGNTNIPLSFFEKHISLGDTCGVDKVNWDCLSKIQIYHLHFLKNILIKLIGIIYQKIQIFHLHFLKNILIKLIGLFII